MRALSAFASRDSGLFLGSGLLLLIVLLIGVGREQHWGERSFRVHLRTPTAQGLKPGMVVKLSGLPVGRVTDLSLQEDATVAIELRIDERYRRLIGPKSLAYQSQDGLVGDSYIALTPQPQATAPGGGADPPGPQPALSAFSGSAPGAARSGPGAYRTLQHPAARQPGGRSGSAPGPD